MASSTFPPNNHSPRTVVRFFKIILRGSLEDGNLKIPTKFTRKYGGNVPSPVYLKPPDGTEWKVEWTKHDGGILFEKGWKEFATYYSLDHGHLLLFEYNGTSHFEVHILDMSGLEIDYPFDYRIDDDSVKILNEPPPRRRGRPRKRLKTPISSPSTSKQLRSAIKAGDVDRSPNLQATPSEETNLEMLVIASVNRDLESKKIRRKQNSKSLISPCPARSESLKEAKKFKCENPSFIVKITRSNLTKSAYLPAAFFRENFENNEQNVKIRFGRKLWPVKLIYYPLTSTTIISAGWRSFARASKLQAGDVCIFELINRKDPVLDVHIGRRHGFDPGTSGFQSLKEAKKFNSENPSFIVKIRHSNLTGSKASLPAAFFRKYFENKQQNVKIRFGSQLWPAKLVYYPSISNAVISTGWRSFAQASKLQAGDVCIFELINGKDPAVLDVYIGRRHGKAIH